MKKTIILIREVVMHPKLLLYGALFLFCTGVQAQGISISGTVTSSEDNDGIPGVNIRVSGSTQGTSTDLSGKYTLSVPGAESVLEFSSVGYATQEVTVGNRTVINVVMTQDVTQLSEVVVTALGIQREEKSLTYAQQTVDGSSLTETRNLNFVGSLTGRVAGVDIKQSSSGPGGSTRIILRGNKSLSGNSEPLFVIDGIPMANNKGGQPGMWGGIDGGDGMSQINQDDIESISVLKGANAAALYGSQGANGVVVITTKKGKAGATKVDFNTGVTFENVMLKPSLQFKYGAIGGAKESWSPTPGNYESGYVDEFFQTGMNTINSLAVSGGNDKTTAYLSYMNTSAKGIIPNNTYGRHNITVKQSTKMFKDKLTASSSAMLSAEKTNNRPPAGYYLNALTGLYMFPRERNFADFKENYEVFNTTRNMYLQNWFVNDHHQSNPYWIINNQPREDLTKRVISSVDLNYAFSEKFSIAMRGNYDYALKSKDHKLYAGSNYTNVHVNGSWDYSSYTDELIYSDGIARYHDDLGDLSVDVVAGASYQKTVYGLGTSVTGNASTGLIYPNEFYFHNLPTNVPVYSTLSSRLIKQSVFANASIGYKDMLFLDLSGRNDWASTLAGTGNGSYFYPSFGLTYILTQNLPLPEAISFAKIRASSSTVSNEVPFNVVNPQHSINSGGGVSRNTTKPFDDLKPELIRSMEIGTEWRFMEDKIGFDFTYYNINSQNQFIPLPAPSGSGYTTYYVNAGEIVNKGVEVAVNATPVEANGFAWKTQVNFSKNTNTIVELHEDLKNPISTGESEGYGSRFEAGGSMGDIYVYMFQRDAQGRIMLDPGNGKPLKTAKQELAGSLYPDWILGWDNNLSYNNFSLRFLVSGKFGGVAFSQTESMLDGAGVSLRTAEARDNGGVVVDASRDGTAVSKVDAELWYRAIGDRNGVGEPYIYDRTSVRLTQLGLAYNFNLSGKNMFLKAASLSLVGQNLFFLALNAPFDPELAMSTNRNAQSLDNFNLPATRTIGLNVKVTF